MQAGIQKFVDDRTSSPHEPIQKILGAVLKHGSRNGNSDRHHDHCFRQIAEFHEATFLVTGCLKTCISRLSDLVASGSLRD